MNLFEEGAKTLKKDNGKLISLVNIPLTKAYANEETERLSNIYDVHSHCGWVLNSLGSSTTENYAGSLFKAYSFCGKFCGFIKNELEDLGIQTRSGDHHVERLQAGYHLKLECIAGEEVLFPTEKFLKNQLIKKKSAI